MTRATRFMAERLYRLALLAFPAQLRTHYGDEMCSDFAISYAQRRQLSPRAGRRFAARAWLDAVRAGIGSRMNRGVGDPGRPNRGSGRAAREWLWTELGSDLRFALRSLRKEPAFAVTVILVLALGVGINGALSNALNAVFLAPPPYPEPDRMVILDLALQEIGSEEPPRPLVWSYPKYEMLAATEDLAAAPIAAYARRNVTITGRGAARQDLAEIVTPDYFAILGISIPGASDLGPDETILSHGLARTLFGEASPIGETVVMNGQAQVVAGVAPAGFQGLTGRADLWIPMAAVPTAISPTLLENYDGHWLLAVGRLRDGHTFDELAAQMPAIGARVHESYAWDDPTTEQTGSIRRFDEARQNPDAQRAVAVVTSAGAVVLLMACLNLAVLMHARVRRRHQEIAVRLALGSSRSRVARILLVETLALAALAGAAGVGVAAIAARAIAGAWPSSFVNGMWNVQFVDTTGLEFSAASAIVTFALAGLAGVIFAIVPILRITKADVGAAMRAGGRSETGRGGGSRWLVTTEVAIALVLTVGAGLMISSLARLGDVPEGFGPTNLVVFNYVLARGSTEAEDPSRFHDAFLERVRGLPGVVGATQDCSAPLDGHCWITGVRRAGDVRYAEGETPRIGVHLVDPAHFDVLGIPLRHGRLFRPDEDADTAAVAIINEAAADVLFPDGSPVGQPITAGVSLTSGEDTAEIVGVVGDVRYDSPADGVMPEMYILSRQEPGRDTAVIVRAAGEPLSLLPLLRAELAEVAPDVPLTAPRTVADLGDAQVGDTTAVMRLLTAFAALAVLLAATGVWGTVAQAVGQRRREMGIRIALGARASQVVRQSLRFGLVWAALGAAVGLLASYYLSRTMAAFLFEVTPTDALAYGASALVLVLVSTLASYLPARRAGQVDPVQTLRAD